MDFFDRVKQLTKASGITIATVANKAGLSIDSYNSYRRHGNLPRADEAVRIAQSLNTTVEYLVTGEESSDSARALAELKARVLDFAKSIQ